MVVFVGYIIIFFHRVSFLYENLHLEKFCVQSDRKFNMCKVYFGAWSCQVYKYTVLVTIFWGSPFKMLITFQANLVSWRGARPRGTQAPLLPLPHWLPPQRLLRQERRQEAGLNSHVCGSQQSRVRVSAVTCAVLSSHVWESLRSRVRVWTVTCAGLSSHVCGPQQSRVLVSAVTCAGLSSHVCESLQSRMRVLAVPCAGLTQSRVWAGLVTCGHAQPMRNKKKVATIMIEW